MNSDFFPLFFIYLKNKENEVSLASVAKRVNYVYKSLTN